MLPLGTASAAFTAFTQPEPAQVPADHTAAPPPQAQASAPGQFNTARLLEIFAHKASRFRSVKIAKHEVIYCEGQTDQNIYMIEFGQVKSIACSPSGRHCLLSIRGTGEFVGELGLLYSSRRETVAAMKSTRLRCIPTADFRAELGAENLFDEFVLYLLGHISEQQAVIANMVTMNSEQRLAATLLELASKLGTRRGSATYINDRITQEELSAMVGTTRSRVGLFLKRFRENGMIVMDRPSVAVNENLLRQYLSQAA